MKESLGILKVLALAAGIAFCARSARAQLEVRPPSIDFGEHGQNERPEASFTILNRGASPIQVREIKTSCSCMTIIPAQLPSPIPAGGEVQVRVTMGSGRAMGRLDKWITILSQDSQRPELKVPISMRVLEDFNMEPTEARFEGVVGGAPQRVSIDITLRRGAPAVPVHLDVKGIHGRFNRPSESHLQPSTAPIPGGQRLTLELSPRHPEGLISAELEATLNGKSLFIPITGQMFAWIKVSPNFINFSRALETEPASTVREVLLAATDGKPFKVLEIDAKPARAREKSVRLEFAVVATAATAAPAPPAPGAGQSPPPPAGGPDQAPGAGPAATGQRIICRAFRGEGEEPTFFGTVTIRTDHPEKPVISLKYSGFFAPPAKK